ncbi:hypothetical protein [Limnohabitans sp. WS1]|uniref:hypothetical protein n=1 Tax=Limnohabitans sp. WS1 TaxID=1100726 RepID=UPI000D38E8D3|nr:hypothetical protein [Limnohabitans sp. WS1]PUE11985.1 hypothetical protein B9Z48_17145 [Limnohabitans sp. WS1]
MRSFPTKISACAIAAAALLSACGGGGTTPGANNNSAVSGSTGACTAAPCINFAETTLGMVDFGTLGIAVANDPADATNKVAKLTKTTGSETWAGVTVHLGGAGNSVTRIDPALGITLRVYSPAVGKTIMVKIEDASNDTLNVEANATSTKAGEWETLTFTYASANPAITYNKVSVFPGFNTKLNEVYYIDELKYTAKAADVVTPPTTGGTVLTLSSGFTSAVLTAEGGAIKSAGGSNFDGFSCNGNVESCGTFAGGSGADSYMGFYYQTSSAASALYSQIEVFAPNITALSTTADTDGVTVTNQTKVNFTFNQNPEWFSGANNKFGVVITLGKRYAVGEGCHIELHGVKTPTSVDATAYTMNLRDDFRVAQDCGTGIAQTDVAAALSASPVISSVKFLGAGGGAAIIGRNSVSSGANLTTATGGGVYPTTVVLKGGITID